MVNQSVNNSNIIIQQRNHEYYGLINYRLVLVFDVLDFQKNLVDLDLVDDEIKDNYIGFNVPKDLKSSLKHRDMISVGIYYTGLYRNIFDATMVQSNLLNFYLYAVLYEDNIEWSNKNTKYFENGGRCKKLPIAVKSNVIDKFYNKYGNYFSRYNFTTHDEVCDYLKIANIL